jgi:hypothetical protein
MAKNMMARVGVVWRGGEVADVEVADVTEAGTLN